MHTTFSMFKGDKSNANASSTHNSEYGMNSEQGMCYFAIKAPGHVSSCTNDSSEIELEITCQVQVSRVVSTNQSTDTLHVLWHLLTFSFSLGESTPLENKQTMRVICQSK